MCLSYKCVKIVQGHRGLKLRETVGISRHRLLSASVSGSLLVPCTECSQFIREVEDHKDKPTQRGSSQLGWPSTGSGIA